MPALIESEHPRCAHLIREYLTCSRTASLFSKVFTGECTSVKYQLDACFRDEKIERTKRNIVKAQVVKDRMKEVRRARSKPASEVSQEV